MSLASSTRRGWLLFAGGALLKRAQAAEGPEPSARQILDRMAAAYARCRTYQDSGRVTRVFVSAGGRREDTMPFATAFIRPSSFRFEFFSGDRRFLAVTDGSATRTWWDVQPGVKDAPSLDLALAGATGISGGAAHTVPVLLMPERISGRRLADLVELQRLDDASLDGIDCFRVQGELRSDRDAAKQDEIRQQVLKVTGRDLGIWKMAPEVLWIDKTSLLLRRIERLTAHGEWTVQTVTAYKPEVDGEIAESQLAFDPTSRSASEPR